MLSARFLFLNDNNGFYLFECLESPAKTKPDSCHPVLTLLFLFLESPKEFTTLLREELATHGDADTLEAEAGESQLEQLGKILFQNYF